MDVLIKKWMYFAKEVNKRRRTTEMKKPILIIMAAGMGSRYGGLKQIDPISDQG